MSDLSEIHADRVSDDVMRAYGDFVGSFGAGDLQSKIHRAINAVAPVDRFYIYEQNQSLQQRPNMIAARYEAWLGDRVDSWAERFRFADPVCEAFRAAQRPGSRFLLRVRPSDISEPDYRRPFFDESDIIERISIIQRTGCRWLVLHGARHRSSGAFGDAELGALASLSRILLPLAARQCELQQPPAAAGRPAVGEIENRFATRYPQLSRRERQVSARTAIGMTMEATAIELGIGIASVQTYRKRAYGRLGISSAYQLAQLVMN